MADIQYIVISDLHLGASNSILTNLTPDCLGTIPHEPSSLLKQYVDCLLQTVSSNASGRPITLILNGDFLELALAGINESSMVFEAFIDLLMTDPRAVRLSPRILCLAGNHDHHLWNVARETRYSGQYLTSVPEGEYLRQEYYVTTMMEGSPGQKIPLDSLNTLVHRHAKLQAVAFETVYPNYALVNEAKTRCVVIHHGHFIESIYSLMTSLKDTLFPDRDGITAFSELEAENGAWVDFFWSTLGRSGQVGADVELIYDKMQDEQQFEALLRNLAANLSPNLPPKMRYFSSLKAELLCIALRFILGKVAKREVHETGGVLSSDAEAGLSRYLEVFLAPAIREENAGTLPPEMTFIFGHTHKPFESLRRAEGYPEQIQVLNSGGWVVDTLQPDPLHGASIVVIDEELNTASIRLYNEGDAETQPVTVVSAQPHNPLVPELQSRLRLDDSRWVALRKSALLAVAEHRKNLAYKVHKA